MMLKIKEDAMQALSENPHLSDVRTILADPQGECSKRQIITNTELDGANPRTMLSRLRSAAAAALSQVIKGGGGSEDRK